ncbi:hypothetical protein EMPS_00746 [Entomortierella parvispora]|uniref:Uncharacterized protein n=1 Tax=Entomortierella parvispora TaxID=205924 RepID=A0A9P3H1J7_9FUNG|nr:hypothetical protein EMPS_00746 [Entomortierella parvispora]
MDLPPPKEQCRNPLDLPEIVQHVGLYLTLPSLKASLCVSRTWHVSLASLVWSDVRICPDSGYPAERVPSFHAVRKYSSLVRKLQICYTHSVDFSQDLDDEDDSTASSHLITYPFLSELVMTPSMGAAKVADPSVCAFVRRHQDTLEEVWLNLTGPVELFEALAETPRLRRLTMVHPLEIEDPEQWISLYERLWSRIRVVGFMGAFPEVISPSSSSISVTTIPPQTKTISTEGWRRSAGPNRTEDLFLRLQDVSVYSAHIWILEQLPELIRLCWCMSMMSPLQHRLLSTRSKSPMCALADIIQSGESLQRLEDLELAHIRFRNEDFMALMRAIPQLTRLCLPSSNFNLGSWKGLQAVAPSHLLTLRELDLYGCKDLSGAAIQSMLTTIPNLESFSANEVTDAEILEDDRPWVCLKLKVLNLRFLVRSSSSHGMICARLSTLTRLEALISGTPSAGFGSTLRLLLRGKEDEKEEKGEVEWSSGRGEDGRGEDGRGEDGREGDEEGDYGHEEDKAVRGGLDLLKGLKQLQVLILPPSDRPKAAEARWMLKHWPVLCLPSKSTLENRIRNSEL